MPVMPSWVDYVPEWKQARAVEDEAAAKARGGAMTFADAAAEAVRLLVLVKVDATGFVMKHYREPLTLEHATMSAAHGPDRVFGVIALANAYAMSGGYIPGVYDPNTGAGSEREIAVLAELAASGVQSRPLAYAALAVGRADLVSAFSDDPVVAKLAAARDAKAFIDFVAAFPDSDVGYAELGLVARAYVVRMEDARFDRIGTAGPWLHRTVHEGPQPVTPRPEPPKAPERQPIPRIEPTWIALHDIHGLWGGFSIDVAPDGTATIVIVKGGAQYVSTRQYRLTPDELAELRNVVASNDPRGIVIPQRNGIAGEACPSLVFVPQEGTKHHVAKWANDRHPGFDAIAGRLASIAMRVGQSGQS